MPESKKTKYNPQTDPCQPDIPQISASVCASLPMGVIVYSDDLRIIQANPLAGQLIDLSERIDTSLLSGTDPNVWGDWKSQVTEVLSTAQTATFDSVEYFSKDARRLIRIILTPVKPDPSDQVSGGIALIEDITEKDSIANELSQAERLAALGKVAGKVAHELNNPMDGILRYINLAVRAIENGHHDKPVEYLNHCKTGLMRMTKIIGQLLEFSRGRGPALQSATIERILEEAVRTMEPKCGEIQISVVDSLEPIEKNFRGDNLFQVFCNLIKNAADAMQSTGDLDITVSSDDHNIIIEFKDTGPGFDPDHAVSIFEPFFTTKKDGAGTGLGLAICKDIIEKYNGRIEAQNNEDQGSKFTVYLPLNE